MLRRRAAAGRPRRTRRAPRRAARGRARAGVRTARASAGGAEQPGGRRCRRARVPVAAAAQQGRLGDGRDVGERRRAGSRPPPRAWRAGAGRRSWPGRRRPAEHAGDLRANSRVRTWSGRGVAGEDVPHDDVGARVRPPGELGAGVARPGSAARGSAAGRTSPRTSSASAVSSSTASWRDPGASASTARGQRAARGAEVDDAAAGRPAVADPVDDRRHLLHVLELEPGRVREVQVGARHAVDQTTVTPSGRRGRGPARPCRSRSPPDPPASDAGSRGWSVGGSTRADVAERPPATVTAPP